MNWRGAFVALPASPLLGPDETYRKADGAVDSLPVGSGSWLFLQEADGTHQVEWSMKALSNVNNFWSSTQRSCCWKSATRSG